MSLREGERERATERERERERKKCVIQSFSYLITEKFMKTIIAYRWIIKDASKYLKIDNKL